MTLKVISSDAAKVALTLDNVKADGYDFKRELTSGKPESISTYAIDFVRGKKVLSCLVIAYPSILVAGRHYNDMEASFERYIFCLCLLSLCLVAIMRQWFINV